MSTPLSPLVVSLGRSSAGEGGSLGLSEPNRDLTLAEAWRAVQGGGRWLEAQGVKRGDRVALLAGNSSAFAVAYYATHAIGAVAVPVGADVSAAGHAQIFEDCRPSLILAEDPTKAAAPGARELPSVDAWLAAEATLEPRCALADPCDLLFTTGTTGRRKGVLLSHANVASAATNINAFVGATAEDVEVVPIPLSHSFGLGRLRCWALVGHRLILERGLRNPALLFKLLVDRRATGLAIVPAGVALLRRMVGARLGEVAARLRYVELGSAALTAEDRRYLLDVLPTTRICHHYGLTEASRAAFVELHADRERSGSAGRASPNVELMIAGDRGEALPPGAWGEVRVRGGMVMQGYWERPEQTQATLVDGWLRTGDEGSLDQDGYLWLRGRREDVINVGGLKVSPLDVEAALRELDGVKDAGCIGVTDPRGVLGQVVKAFIVSDADLDERGIVARLQSRLPEHEVPRAFERVPSLPKTESGKLKRAELREREANG